MTIPTDLPPASNTPPDRSTPVVTDANALGMRVLYMVIFGVVFWILCWTLAVTAVLQLVFRLINGAPSVELSRFGGGLALFAQQVIEYLTFRTERLPFPFSDWPYA